MAFQLIVELTQGVQGLTNYPIDLTARRPVILRVYPLGMTSKQLHGCHVAVVVHKNTTGDPVAEYVSPSQPLGLSVAPPIENGSIQLINRATTGSPYYGIIGARLNPHQSFNFLLQAEICTEDLHVEVTASAWGRTKIRSVVATFPRAAFEPRVTIVLDRLPNLAPPGRAQVARQLGLLPLLFPIVGVVPNFIEHTMTWTNPGDPTLDDVLAELAPLQVGTTGLFLGAVGDGWSSGIVGWTDTSPSGGVRSSVYTTMGGVTLAAHELGHQLGLPHAPGEGRFELNSAQSVDVVGVYVRPLPLRLFAPKPSDTRDFMYETLEDVPVPPTPDRGRWARAWSWNKVFDKLKARPVPATSEFMAVVVLTDVHGTPQLRAAYMVRNGASDPTQFDNRLDGRVRVLDQTLSTPLSSWVRLAPSSPTSGTAGVGVRLIGDHDFGAVGFRPAVGPMVTLPVAQSNVGGPTELTVSVGPDSDDGLPRASVSWAPVDPTLRYLVRFTPDDGEHWFAVAEGLFPDGTVTVNLGGIIRQPNGTNRFEVSASNGTRPMLSDRVDVPASDRQMVIVTPNPDDGPPTLHRHESALLSGTVLGPPLGADGYEWSVVRAGAGAAEPIGNARQMIVRGSQFGLGLNTIRLTGPPGSSPAEVLVTVVV